VAELAHLPALAGRPELALVALAEPLPARRDLARSLIPGVRVYKDLASLLQRESDLDFVDLCTPPHSHAGLALAALKHGCHVLSEKPLSLSTEEFRELKEALTRNAAAALVTVHNWKYAPILAETAALLRAGPWAEFSRWSGRFTAPTPRAGACPPGAGTRPILWVAS